MCLKKTWQQKFHRDQQPLRSKSVYISQVFGPRNCVTRPWDMQHFGCQRKAKRFVGEDMGPWRPPMLHSLFEGMWKLVQLQLLIQFQYIGSFYNHYSVRHVKIYIGCFAKRASRHFRYRCILKKRCFGAIFIATKTHHSLLCGVGDILHQAVKMAPIILSF